MIQILVGLGAGSASALLYFAVLSGTALALALFYIAPLPIIVAGLGWGITTGLIAALSGAALAGIITAPPLGLVFLLACSAPAVWLARLAVLGRPVDPDDPEKGVEWYPPERLILWTVAMATGVVLFGALMMGAGTDAFRHSIAEVLDRMVAGEAGAALGFSEDLDTAALSQGLARVLPAVSAAIWTLTMLLNLWLGGRITIASGRLARPMPGFAGMRYPTTVALAFGVALALAFVPGVPGLAGGIAATALLVAYFLLGLAVIHMVTRDMAGRAFLLAGLYMMVLLVIWVVPVIAMLGLAEHILRLRERMAQTHT